MRSRGIGAGVALALGTMACGGEPSPRPVVAKPVVSARPVVTAAPTPAVTSEPVPEPKPPILPGIDTTALSDKQAEIFEEVVNEQPAPCDDVKATIAECVKRDLDCAACVPAAEITAHALEERSANKDSAISALQARFSKDVKRFDLTDSPSRGPSDAPVTVIAWRDFLIEQTSKEMEGIEDVIERHEKEVRLVHKFMTWPLVDNSAIAAKTAFAAHRQGKFWEMADVLIAHSGDDFDANKAFLAQSAKDLGLDMKRYAKDIADPKTARILARDFKEAVGLGYGKDFLADSFVFINGRHAELPADDWVLEHWITSEIKIVRREKEKRAEKEEAARESRTRGAGPKPQ